MENIQDTIDTLKSQIRNLEQTLNSKEKEQRELEFKKLSNKFDKLIKDKFPVLLNKKYFTVNISKSDYSSASEFAYKIIFKYEYKYTQKIFYRTTKEPEQIGRAGTSVQLLKSFTIDRAFLEIENFLDKIKNVNSRPFRIMDDIESAELTLLVLKNQLTAHEEALKELGLNCFK